MALFGNESAVTTNQSSVSTQTVTDSYNQTFSSANNFANSGNVSVNLPAGFSAGSSPLMIIAGLALVGVLVWLIKKKG